MQRLTRELALAEAEIKAARTANTAIEQTLAAALQAAANCQGTYLAAPGNIRRQINQGFFEKLFIGEDGQVERAAFTEPFKSLLKLGGHDGSAVVTDSTHKTTDRPRMQMVGGLNDEDVVGPTGFEPMTYEV